MNPPLTRRETVAVAVLQGMLAYPDRNNIVDPDVFVKAALVFTDALIRELDRNPAPVSPAASFIGLLEKHGLKICEEIANLAGRRAPRILESQCDEAPVSPLAASALPLCPDHIPKPPKGCVYFGNRPLTVLANDSERDDVYSLDDSFTDMAWQNGFEGSTDARFFHYALRRGSPIAIANGILD